MFVVPFAFELGRPHQHHDWLTIPLFRTPVSEPEPDIMVFAGLTAPNAILAQATEIVE